MAINKYQPHLIIFYEDAAYLELANAFLQTPLVADRNIAKARNPAKGTLKLFDMFLEHYAKEGEVNPKKHFLLLFDLDNGLKQGAFDHFREQLVQEFPTAARRVFFLSCQDEAEALKRELSMSYEEIGKKIAEECSTTQTEPYLPSPLWNCKQLGHNQTQLSLLSQAVSHFVLTATVS